MNNMHYCYHLILKIRVQSLNVVENLFTIFYFSFGVGFVDKKSIKYLDISLLAFARPIKIKVLHHY